MNKKYVHHSDPKNLKSGSDLIRLDSTRGEEFIKVAGLIDCTRDVPILVTATVRLLKSTP